MRYEDLPPQIRAQISEREWLWLDDIEKQRFLDNTTEPETSEVD